MRTSEHIKEIVTTTYGNLAKHANKSCCGGCDCGGEAVNPFVTGYDNVEGHYAGADLGLGCGIPTQFAAIQAGDVVLDLGAGAGNDAFVARSLVGTTGQVIGVDITEAMVVLAQKNTARLGYENVEFRLGDIERLPVADAEIDVVISNCVLNLVPDKEAAFQEIYRVLKAGGHFCVSDVVMQGNLPPALKQAAEMYAGCVAGASQRDDYLRIIQEAGLATPEIKQERQIVLTDDLLAAYLASDEIQQYRQSGHKLLSLTVFAQKPEE